SSKVREIAATRSCGQGVTLIRGAVSCAKAKPLINSTRQVHLRFIRPLLSKVLRASGFPMAPRLDWTTAKADPMAQTRYALRLCLDLAILVRGRRHAGHFLSLPRRNAPWTATAARQPHRSRFFC